MSSYLANIDYGDLYYKLRCNPSHNYVINPHDNVPNRKRRIQLFGPLGTGSTTNGVPALVEQLPIHSRMLEQQKPFGIRSPTWILPHTTTTLASGSCIYLHCTTMDAPSLVQSIIYVVCRLKVAAQSHRIKQTNAVLDVIIWAFATGCQHYVCCRIFSTYIPL